MAINAVSALVVTPDGRRGEGLDIQPRITV